MSIPRTPCGITHLAARMLVAVLLVAATACAGKASLQQRPSDDQWIVAEVRRKLDEDRRIDAAEIAVESVHGIVVLSGIVGSNDEARRALRIAGRVPGVTQVVNRLRVLSTA